jgi:rod shape-determining protein MreD
MAIVIGTPILALLAILQSSIVNDLTFLDGRPDLVLLAVISWAVIGRHTESMILGLIGGLFLDLLSGFPLGITAINLILITFLVSFSEGRFWESHVLMPLGVALFSSLIFYLFSLGAVWIIGQPVDLVQLIVRTVLPGTFLNLILILPTTQLAHALDRAIRPPEVEI